MLYIGCMLSVRRVFLCNPFVLNFAHVSRSAPRYYPSSSARRPLARFAHSSGSGSHSEFSHRNITTITTMSKHTRTPSTLQVISISDTFDSGNVKLAKVIPRDGNDYQVNLQIRRDAFTELEQKHHYQYFCFRAMVNDLNPDEKMEVTYVIENADSVSYPVAWEGTTVFYTYVYKKQRALFSLYLKVLSNLY